MFGNVSATFKAIATIATMLVVLIVIGIAGYFFWMHLSANHALVKAQIQAGTATVAAGQAQASQAAQQVVVTGEARDHLDIAVHQENAVAIQAAHGADASIDPAVIAAANVGLCRYPSESADPRCAGVQPANPGFISPAGGLSGSALAD